MTLPEKISQHIINVKTIKKIIQENKYLSILNRAFLENIIKSDKSKTTALNGNVTVRLNNGSSTPTKKKDVTHCTPTNTSRTFKLLNLLKLIPNILY